MRRTGRLALAVMAALLVGVAPILAEGNVQWPQFLGPGGTGLGDDDASPPSEFGPAKALLWKTDIPSGVGSPSVWGDRIFVTAFEETTETLEVIAVDRTSGAIAWRRPVAVEGIEAVHAVSCPATSTPATDGEKVYVYFGSYGLLAYDWDGTLAWGHPMGVAKSPFGSGTSPVLAGDLVLLTRDYPPDPYMIAVRRGDGRLAWRVELSPGTAPGVNTAHSTPVIWQDRIVLHRSGEVSAYRPEDGTLAWRIDTLSPGTSTPSPARGALYVTAFPMLADPANAVEIPPYATIVSQHDANDDGKLSREELPENGLYVVRRAGMPESVPGAHVTIKMIFSMVDDDEDGLMDAAELDGLVASLDSFAATTSATGLIAIRPGGASEEAAASVKWTYERNVPEVASPLSYRGRVYMIKSGGIVSCVSAESGEAVYRGRVGARGPYYASPVAAGGRIFVASAGGVVTVLGGGDSLEVLANNDLGDPVYGTLAPVGGALYVRSLHHLWAFGESAVGTIQGPGVGGVAQASPEASSGDGRESRDR